MAALARPWLSLSTNIATGRLIGSEAMVNSSNISRDGSLTSISTTSGLKSLILAASPDRSDTTLIVTIPILFRAATISFARFASCSTTTIEIWAVILWFVQPTDMVSNGNRDKRPLITSICLINKQNPNRLSGVTHLPNPTGKLQMIPKAKFPLRLFSFGGRPASAYPEASHSSGISPTAARYDPHPARQALSEWRI